MLFVDPPRAIQLVIIISTALSFVALPGLWRAIAPGLLLRLGLGSLAGLPLGLVACRYADPVVVRVLVGAAILADPAGLPPADLIVGGLDPLLDDSHHLAARLKEAHVPCKLTVYDGINHGFIRYGRLIATARRAVGDCAAALHNALVAMR